MPALPMLRRGEEGSLPALRARWVQPPRVAAASSTNATVPPKPIRRQKTDEASPAARASVERTSSSAKSRAGAASSQDMKAAKRRAGRPSRITRNRHNIIMTCLQLGQSRRVAAETVGISPSTITRAMRRDPLFAADITYAEEIGVLFRREFGWLFPERRRKRDAANAAEKRRLQNTGSLPKGTPPVAKKQPISRPAA